MLTEADTCRKFVVPKLQAAGWDNDPHSIAEQRWLTSGRIVVRGNHAERRKGTCVEYFEFCVNENYYSLQIGDGSLLQIDLRADSCGILAGGSLAFAPRPG